MATITKCEEHVPYEIWYTKTHTEARAASDACEDSGKLREDARAFRVNSDIQTVFDQRDTNNRISDRIHSVKQWRDELENKRKHLEEMTRRVGTAKRITEQFMSKLNDTQNVNVECLTHMDHRQGSEYVMDPVEAKLIEEKELLAEIYNDLQGQVDDAFNTLVDLQNSMQSFYGDIADKTDAIHVDMDQYNLTEKSAGVSFKPFYDRKLTSDLDIQTWDDRSRAVLAKAECQIQKANDMLHKLHDGIHKAANRIAAKAERVGDALRFRLHETEHVIRVLDFQKAKTEEERDKMANEITRLEETRQAKIGSLKLAQTRLEGRQDRLRAENNEDAAYHGLLDEVRALQDAIKDLDDKIAESRLMLQRVDTQIGLMCEEINSKKGALAIYRNIVNIRKRLEQQPATSDPVCPMLPDGIVRQPVQF